MISPDLDVRPDSNISQIIFLLYHHYYCLTFSCFIKKYWLCFYSHCFICVFSSRLFFHSWENQGEVMAEYPPIASSPWFPFPKPASVLWWKFLSKILISLFCLKHFQQILITYKIRSDVLTVVKKPFPDLCRCGSPTTGICPCGRGRWFAHLFFCMFFHSL